MIAMGRAEFDATLAPIRVKPSKGLRSSTCRYITLYTDHVPSRRGQAALEVNDQIMQTWPNSEYARRSCCELRALNLA
jgi:hypothetical protein